MQTMHTFVPRRNVETDKVSNTGAKRFKYYYYYWHNHATDITDINALTLHQ